jgi:hypothetical protein
MSTIKDVLLDGSGDRRLESWIDSFVKKTENLESPSIFRRWTAISVIAAAIEQKVWIQTSAPMLPNLYVVLVGHPGIGKTRVIRAGRGYVRRLGTVHIAPISLTWASLVDSLDEAKRQLLSYGVEFNSMYICADELGAFIHKYDNEMVAGLSALYDLDPYTQRRRTGGINIKIQSPQLNILTGSTPQNLMDFMPEKAWGQGLTARLIMVFSDERTVGDDFAGTASGTGDDLDHDLLVIHNLYGQFKVTDAYRQCVNNWRALGELPVPNHPKLLHYVTRRRSNLYKLSMISAVDRSNQLTLGRDDFNQAMGWLLQVEETMPEVFRAGAANADGLAMDEIGHFVMINDRGEGVSERAITHFARDRIPLNSILRIVEIMVASGMIRCVRIDQRTGARYFRPGAQL